MRHHPLQREKGQKPIEIDQLRQPLHACLKISAPQSCCDRTEIAVIVDAITCILFEFRIQILHKSAIV